MTSRPLRFVGLATSSAGYYFLAVYDWKILLGVLLVVLGLTVLEVSRK